MKKVPFWKMSGSGNDFVVIDNRQSVIRGPAAGWARQLCHRQFGIGADGLLLLERPLRQSSRYGRPAVTADQPLRQVSRYGRSAVTADPPLQRPAFRMVYYNADGSRAAMCGNGARCMAWAAHQWKAAGPRMDFWTDAGLVHGEVKGDIVRITLSDPHDFRPQMRLKALGRTYRLAFINTGVPHAVVRVPQAEKVDIMKEGRALRFHPAFGPSGANINFVERRDDHTLRVRTYERGVEGETLACGTGVSASAVAAALRGWVRPVVRCQTTGGDTLQVQFELHPEDPAHPARRVTLEGPVRRTFVGTVER